MGANPHTDDPTLAVVIERLDNLRTEVGLLRGELAQQAAGYVSRAEFDAWREGIGRELADYKSALIRAESAAQAAQQTADSRRPSGWTIAVGLAALIASAAALIPALAK